MGVLGRICLAVLSLALLISTVNGVDHWRRDDGAFCTYGWEDNIDPHFTKQHTLQGWLDALKPAHDACPNGGLDESKIDWSKAPWMLPSG
jgi:hypothetical protein